MIQNVFVQSRDKYISAAFEPKKKNIRMIFCSRRAQQAVK